MRLSSIALTLSLLRLFAVGAFAEEPAMPQIARAAQLNDAGRFREAIEIVDPLLHAEEAEANEQTGIAWNLRGLALQNLGDRVEARRSYEASLRILRGVPAPQAGYAAALDNLGSLEADEGHFGESKSLRRRAMQLYMSVGDRAGVARTLNRLALLAIRQSKDGEAGKDIADAFREEALLAKPDDGDLAAMYSTLALNEERKKDFNRVYAAIQQAIELWTRNYGPHYYLLSAGYSIRGRAYDGLHDYPHAMNDMNLALQLLTENGQRNSRVYLLTEVSYAQVLRHAGSKQEAVRMETSARAELDSLRQGCVGCTISAESLR